MDLHTTDAPLATHADGTDEQDAVHTLLVRTLADTRWFPAKGTGTLPRPLARLRLEDPEGEAEVQIRLLVLPTGAVLQVPLTLRPAGSGGAEDAGDAGDPDGGADEPGGVLGVVDGRTVRDGCHDPAFVRAWLAVARSPERVGVPVPAAAVASMRVLTGEQSNTSVLLPEADPPAILKVFRVLTAGPSPDVDVPLALSSLGWRGVPTPLAWLAARWPATGTAAADPEGAVGHLGVLSELVAGAEDGFALACRYAAAGTDVTELADDLGRTTAQMHRALRTALPVRHDERGPRTPAARAATAHHVTRVLRERAAAAFDAVEALADRAEAVARVLDQVEHLSDLPPVQRVHGDYHLGQVLHSAAGWSVLDFEGEPQAAAAERTRPDLALRDLAGMLRSFDYAAAVGGATSPQWAEGARAALVAGYAREAGQGGGQDPSAGPLLRALELDKALYEVVYESRNRPDWVHIPLAAVDRLLGRS